MTAHQTVPSATVQCDYCVVRHKAICAALSEQELSDFNRIARQRKIAAGRTITNTGDTEIAFANIISGVVKLTKTLPDGRQQIVGLQFPPDFLGRIFAEESPYNAEAATDVVLCAFPRDGFEAMLRRYPGLEHRLFQNTLDELDAAREWMLLLGRKSAREKVATFLHMIARRAGALGCSHVPDMNQARFTLPLTRSDTADYLGLTLETVSRQITNLKKNGIIELTDTREIVVPDMAALEEAAGE
ncbi:MAG: transcriptional regulator FnrN [Methyloligellaceae bacterium]